MPVEGHVVSRPRATATSVFPANSGPPDERPGPSLAEPSGMVHTPRSGV